LRNISRTVCAGRLASFTTPFVFVLPSIAAYIMLFRVTLRKASGLRRKGLAVHLLCLVDHAAAVRVGLVHEGDRFLQNPRDLLTHSVVYIPNHDQASYATHKPLHAG